ncbi:MAG: hypothetical protein LUO93_07680 [Methanomicrobiales archaeon]|nr:hypothetical protein [Methanomicrobiales archaeon]
MSLSIRAYSCTLTDCHIQGWCSRACVQASITNTLGQTQRASNIEHTSDGMFDINWSFTSLTPGVLYKGYVTAADDCGPPLGFDEYTLVWDSHVLPVSGGEFMTLVLARYTLTIKDADGEKAAFKVFRKIDDANTIVTELAAMAAYRALVEAVVDGKIIFEELVLKRAVTAGKTDPVANSEVEKTGLLNFSLTNSTFTESVDIPAFFLDGFDKNSIIMDDLAVAALTDELTDGSYMNESGVAINEVLDGRKTFRKHRKQTLRARGV